MGTWLYPGEALDVALIAATLYVAGCYLVFRLLIRRTDQGFLGQYRPRLFREKRDGGWTN